jgi:hypothetical protein
MVTIMCGTVQVLYVIIETKKLQKNLIYLFTVHYTSGHKDNNP